MYKVDLIIENYKDKNLLSFCGLFPLRQAGLAQLPVWIQLLYPLAPKQAATSEIYFWLTLSKDLYPNGENPKIRELREYHQKLRLLGKKFFGGP